ncbi:PLP-dependent aminotransferase family protein [Acidobacteriota bacterium]
MNIEKLLADRAKKKAPSPIRELLKYMKIDGMISLGGGYPNPNTFVFENVDIQFRSGQKIKIDGKDLSVASQYGPSDAHGNLKQELISWHKNKDDVSLDTSQLVVLNGCQEGLFIMAYLFIDSKDSIIVSEPTYPGALAAFKSFTKNFVSVPLDADGMNTDLLDGTLSRIQESGETLPKFIYNIPSGHNPGGVALSEKRREHMVQIANKYDILVLEDDPYQLIKLEDSPLPRTMQSLDTEGRVIRLDSFSKIFAPGLRIGYASGSSEIMRQFVLFKQSSNLHTSMFIQEVLQKYLKSAGYENFRKHIKKNCELYRTNRDAMIDAIKKHLPSNVKYNVPKEGMFIWFELPEKCNTKNMIDTYCEELKVLLVPGEAFSTQNGCKNCMRASFSLVTPNQIEEGIKRFARMIQLEIE